MSANWHWKTKSVKDPWCKSWLAQKLVGLTAQGVEITSVDDVEGDAEVGMRKGKVITIYDMKVTCKWKGSEADTTGSLTVLEVSHDMSEDDYQFEAASDQTSPEAAKCKEMARKDLGNLMRPIFQTLHKDMVAAHGKDLLAGGGDSNAPSPAVSGASTPQPTTSGQSTAKDTASASKQSSKAGNTTTVKAEASFMISASDLFELLTDPEKVPMWTRNPAKIKAEKGAEISLFGGNIIGKVVSVDKPREFVTTWRAPTWPADHHGELTSTLTQNAADTTLTLRLTGVPLGKEEETEKNLDIYYIRSLKQIGYDIYPLIDSASTSPASKSNAGPSKAQRFWVTLATLLGPLASFSLMAGIILAIYYGPTFQQ